LETNGISPIFIEPGKPWQNGKCESFNGKLRDECLCREWFASLREARVVIESWRKFSLVATMIRTSIFRGVFSPTGDFLLLQNSQQPALE